MNTDNKSFFNRLLSSLLNDKHTVKIPTMSLYGNKINYSPHVSWFYEPKMPRPVCFPSFRYTKTHVNKLRSSDSKQNSVTFVPERLFRSESVRSVFGNWMESRQEVMSQSCWRSSTRCRRHWRSERSRYAAREERCIRVAFGNTEDV